MNPKPLDPVTYAGRSAIVGHVYAVNEHDVCDLFVNDPAGCVFVFCVLTDDVGPTDEQPHSIGA